MHYAMTDSSISAAAGEQRYTSPEVRVIHVNVKGILCVSGGNEDYKNNEPDDWFI